MSTIYDDLYVAPRRHVPWLAILMVAGLVTGASFVVAGNAEPDVQVVTQPVREQAPITRGYGRSRVPPGDGSQPAPGTEQTCSGSSPGPDWSCHDGSWQLGPPPPAATSASGGGRIDRAAGCVTEQPGPSFSCQNGVWMVGGGAPAIASSVPERTTTGATAVGDASVPCASADQTGRSCVEDASGVVPVISSPAPSLRSEAQTTPTDAGPVEPVPVLAPAPAGGVGTPQASEGR